MFSRGVACPAWPPGDGTEQEVLLATAFSTHLTNTIAVQLHPTVTAAQDFHIKDTATQYWPFDYSRLFGAVQYSVMCV